MELRQLVQGMAVEAPFQHVGEHHGVVDGRHRDAVAASTFMSYLMLWPTLEDGGALQEALERLEGRLQGDLLELLPPPLSPVATVAEIEGALRRRAAWPSGM